MANFKPNIYPIIYWALAYGVAAGLLLFLVNMLAQYIAVVWFPVFLTGLIWGGWRNYRRQKSGAGVPGGGSPMAEFKEAVGDIASASQDLFEAEDGEDVVGDESVELGEIETIEPETDLGAETPGEFDSGSADGQGEGRPPAVPPV